MGDKIYLFSSTISQMITTYQIKMDCQNDSTLKCANQYDNINMYNIYKTMGCNLLTQHHCALQENSKEVFYKYEINN